MDARRGNHLECGALNDPAGKEGPSFADSVAAELADLGRHLCGRGWVLGTSGNLSAVIDREPLRLAITASGVDKGALTAPQILHIDADAHVVSGAGRPSDEALLHLAVVRARGAQAVVHTHSVWSTIVSAAHVGAGGVSITGYEMLKGLTGVITHEHQEWLPIVENSQDMPALAGTVEETLAEHHGTHGFLLQRHGLYTWGGSLAEARRHVEVLEFLLEVIGRSIGRE